MSQTLSIPIRISTSVKFFIVDDTTAVYYTPLPNDGCQANLIAIEDIPEDAIIIDVKEDKK